MLRNVFFRLRGGTVDCGSRNAGPQQMPLKCRDHAQFPANERFIGVQSQ
jgi:hypothetical protein